MVNICFFATHAHHIFKRGERSYGGAEINFYFLSRELAKSKKYNVSFLVGDDGQKDVEYYEGVKLIKFKYFNQNYSSIYFKTLKLFYIIKQFFTNNADVYIMTTALSGNIMFFCIIIAKYIRKKKIIFRAASERDVNGHFTRSKNLAGFFFKYSIHRVDKVIVQTQYQQKLLKNIENLSSKVIKNGFPIPDNPYSVEDKKYFLWVGRCVEIKRPHLFLKIAQQMPNEKFVMIIPGNDNLKKVILTEAERIQNLQIIDFVDFFEIEPYFTASKCFINTSTSEGFPNTFLQSFFSGAPVCSLNVDPDNIIQHFELGHFCHDSIDQAINFLQTLNKEKLDYFEKKCINYVKANHDIADKIKDYEEVIYKLTKKE